MESLFAQPEAPPAATSADDRVVGIVVNANVWGDFDYRFPAALGAPFAGQRVRVPFGRGNRKTLGFVVDPQRRPGRHRLKTVAEVVDHEPQLDEALLDLGRWISHYYLSPLGLVLAAMVPSVVGRVSPKRETVVFLTSEPRDWPGRLGMRQRKLLDELLEARKQGVEPLPLDRLLHHSGAGRDTLHRLVARDLVRTESREVVLEDAIRQVAEPPFSLNDAQQAVVEQILPTLSPEAGFSALLLHGVTGSGKTEVYVRAIRRVVEQGRQALLLTPEIALATQTLQRLLRRLPRVAVLHSGLTDTERAFHWEQIRTGRASVIVGPRSAVFAPARDLGLIVVDEEHEGSYKQDTTPRYHGRDVAVKRAQAAGIPVILGSATPSMESYHNAREGKYTLLRLPQRVRSLSMPTLHIVNLRQEIEPGRVELIGKSLTQQMAMTLDRREQVILLMNRRGYASYVFCPSCKWMLECDDCIRPMVFHQAIQLCLCHHCDARNSLPEHCPACGKKILLFGYGIQRIEDELARKFSQARVARMDSDTMTSPKQFQTVLAEFAAGEIDILLGTQMVAKGLDFPKVSLVGVVSADTALTIHDFRASERTFQLIVQVAGRAGRGEVLGQVVVQTLHAEDPAIQFAKTHDYDGFMENELRDRHEAVLPPFSRLVRFVVRHGKIETAEEGARELHRRLQAILPGDQTRMIGPMQAEFAKIRTHFRFHILIFSEKPGLIQRILSPRMHELTHEISADIQTDCDPLNIL
jgi:primosomal protein N' (replication factor Y)